MVRYLFKRSGNDLPRPHDTSQDKSKVYNLHASEMELKGRRKVLENGHVSLIEMPGKSNTVTYEICLTLNPVTYSIYRTGDKKEAEAVNQRLVRVFNPLISTSSVPRGDMKATGDFVQTAINMALTQMDWSVAHIAARLGIASPFKMKDQTFVTHVNELTVKNKRTVLRNAILSSSEETVSAVLNCGANLDLLDGRGANAIFQAAPLPNHRIFLLILGRYRAQYKTSLDFLRVRDDRGLTALHVACYAEQYDNIVSLLSLSLPMDLLILNRPKSLAFKQNAQQKHRSPTPPKPKRITSREEQEELRRQRSTIVVFTDGMMQDLDWDEVKLGGCPTFWLSKTIFLHKMLELKFPPDITNFCFESAVHVMVRRKALSNLMVLLSNGYPLLPSLAARNTPLHQAVKSCDMSAVQALTSFDADLNSENSRGENPRHLTHNLPAEGKGNGSQILYILHSLGARRCRVKLPDCYPGCDPTGTFDGAKDSAWPELRNPTLYTKSLLEAVVQSAVNGRVGSSNILSCDGGGTKGLITCQILVEMQRHLKHPIHEYFEWISGTSTGSFIAACLSLGMDVKTLRKHYLMLKDEIISGEKPYPSEPIERFCKSLLGPETKMSDITKHKLIITACLGDRFPPQLHLFRSYVSYSEDRSETKNQLHEFLDPDPNHKDWKTQIDHLWFACRASAAAPTYFAPIGPFIDGGVISSNPTLDTISEFVKYQIRMPIEKKESLGIVVSLGTGRWPIVEHPLANVGRLSWSNPLDASRQMQQVMALATMVAGAATNTDSYVVDRGQTSCFLGRIPFFRISPPLSFQMELNVTTDEDLINAMYETKAYFFALSNELPTLVTLLEMIRSKSFAKVRERKTSK